MKIKMFKKIIAALCAATMSTSIVVPTGAINYTVMSDNLPEDQKNALEELDDKIKKGQKNLQKIQKLYSENKKTEDANLISSVIGNFQELDNKSIPNDLEFAKYLHSEVININRLISLMRKYIKDGGNVDVKPITNDINLKIQKLLGEIDEKINKEKQEKERLERENRKLKFETMSKALREKQHLYLQLKKSQKIDTKKVDTQSIAAKVYSCCDLEEKAKKSLSEKILEKYIKESNELISMIDLAEKVEKLNRKFDSVYRLALYRNAREEFYSVLNNDRFEHDRLSLSDDKVRKQIELVDNTSKLLDKLRYKIRYTRGLTVVKKGEVSGLRREAGEKIDKLCRLRDLAIKKLAMIKPDKKKLFGFCFILNSKVNLIINSYYKSNKTNAEDLKKVILKLDNAISGFKWADNNEQDPVLEWQKQAHKDINNLMIDAEKEMENGLNKETTIEALKEEFNPLLCGTQAFGNCWLYAICNTHNILNHLEKKDGIIQNKGERDGDGFDKVENFFKNHAKLSNGVISKGGSLKDQSEVLSKLGINHTSVSLANESKNEESLEKNVNIVKTLLLRHFANSKAPVLIGTKAFWVPFDSNGDHAMVVVGLDIKSNEVAVANSNKEKIEVYNLDDLAYFICKMGEPYFIRKKISMIFTSLNNKEDFKYDNSNNTWDEFESKLLPAISQ